MLDTISCPQCKRKLRRPDAAEGQEVQCPACGTVFTASAGGTPPAPSNRREQVSDQPDLPELPPPTRVEYPPQADDEPPRRPRYRDYQPPRRYRVPHRGSSVLTLGILSLLSALCCPLFGAVLGVLAASQGGSDLSQIRKGDMDREGEGLTQAGQVCGFLGIAFSILAFCAAFSLNPDGIGLWWWRWF